MRVKQYLEQEGNYFDVTFIKARARENANAPGYHAEYQTTPISSVSELLNPNNESILNSVILNDHQMPINWLSGAGGAWEIAIEVGRLRCLLIVSEEDFKLLIPGEDQRNRTEKFIENKLDI